jgi:hypothetical protein
MKTSMKIKISIISISLFTSLSSQASLVFSCGTASVQQMVTPVFNGANLISLNNGNFEICSQNFRGQTVCPEEFKLSKNVETGQVCKITSASSAVFHVSCPGRVPYEVQQIHVVRSNNPFQRMLNVELQAVSGAWATSSALGLDQASNCTVY